MYITRMAQERQVEHFDERPDDGVLGYPANYFKVAMCTAYESSYLVLFSGVHLKV